MHDTFFRILVIAQDTWQNFAIVVLLGDRVATRRRARRLMAAVEAE